MSPNIHNDRRRGDDGFVVLPIDVLKVDRTYQRRYDHGMVLRILALNGGAFDMVWAGPILVNRRQSGDHYVIDGQHRVGMATEAGEKEILAELLLGLTAEQEAELRVARHSRKSDNALEHFHARIASGDKKAVHIAEIVAAKKGAIAEDHSAPITSLQAVRALEKVYDISPKRLEHVLELIGKAYRRPDRKTGSSYMLLGLNWLVEWHSFELDEELLVRRLKSRGLKGIDGRARILSAAGGSMWKNYYRSIVEAYNSHTPDDKKLLMRHG